MIEYKLIGKSLILKIDSNLLKTINEINICTENEIEIVLERTENNKLDFKQQFYVN